MKKHLIKFLSLSIVLTSIGLTSACDIDNDNIETVEEKPVEKKNRFGDLLKKTNGKNFGNCGRIIFSLKLLYDKLLGFFIKERYVADRCQLIIAHISF